MVAIRQILNHKPWCIQQLSSQDYNVIGVEFKTFYKYRAHHHAPYILSIYKFQRNVL